MDNGGNADPPPPWRDPRIDPNMPEYEFVAEDVEFEHDFVNERVPEFDAEEVPEGEVEVEPEESANDRDERPWYKGGGATNWWKKVVEDLADEVDDEEHYISDEENFAEVDNDGVPVYIPRTIFKYSDEIKWEDFKLKVGYEFATRDELKAVLKEVFIQQDRVFDTPTVNKTKLRVVCAHKGCPWVCYARVNLRDGVSFRINTLVDKHECPIVFNSKLIDAPWLAKHFENQFRLCPRMSYNQFLELTTNTKYSHTSMSIFYATKKLAKQRLKGTVAEQYAVLHNYCVNLKNLMPGTTAVIKTELVNDQRILKRVYICLEACKSGFKNCRQVIGLDGTFLKGICKGVLLVAIGIDVIRTNKCNSYKSSYK